VKYLLIALAIWCLAVLNVSVMPYIKVLGVTPDLVLIFAACWAVLRSGDEAFVVVPLAGLMRDLTTSDPLGTSILALAPLVPLARGLQFRAIETRFVSAAAVAAAGSVCFAVISAVVLAATGQAMAWEDVVFRVAVPSGVVNALFTPILYMPVSWFSPARSPVVTGAGRITSPL
jgi:rod shape-determining protein MreD